MNSYRSIGKIKNRQATIVFQGAVAINTLLLLVAIPVAVDRTDIDLRFNWLASPSSRPRQVISEKRKDFEILIQANRRRKDGNFPEFLASQIEQGVA